MFGNVTKPLLNLAIGAIKAVVAERAVPKKTKVHCDISAPRSRMFILEQDNTFCRIFLESEHVVDLYNKIEMEAQTRGLYLGVFVLHYGVSILRKGTRFEDYGIKREARITLKRYFLMGGCKTVRPITFADIPSSPRVYTLIKENEQEVTSACTSLRLYVPKKQTMNLQSLDELWKMTPDPGCENKVYLTVEQTELYKLLKEVQSSDSDSQRDEGWRVMMNAFRDRFDTCMESADAEWAFRQLETFNVLTRFAYRCQDLHDYYSLSICAVRLITGKSFIKEYLNLVDNLFASSEVQACDVSEVLGVFRSAFDMTSKVTESKMMKKLVSLYSYLLTQGYLKNFGITLSDEDYSKMEQRALLSAYSSKKSFWICVLDTTLFIAERLNEWRVTGDISTVLHSAEKYELWYKESDRLLNLAPFVGNLKAHGTSYFSLLADLDNAIEKGEAYAKYTKSTAGVDSIAIKKKLSSLWLFKNTEITRKAAQQERAAPMGVLVHGSSSIAKSSFTKILFNYYGSLFGLERGDDFRFVRNPMDEYWSNFSSSKWCIQLDDIAFRNPAKCADIDPTLQDLLNVVNNVPYVPPQAALEDKGKTPVMAKLVIATSNCATLNAQEYFWCPLAVRRRLPFVVKLVPRPEFLSENQVFIDPRKIVTEEGFFPDLWIIEVHKIKPVLHGDRENAELVLDKSFLDINKFLQYYGKACIEHEANQAKAMAKDKDMLKIEVCKTCYLPLPHAECLELQYGVTTPFTWMFGCLQFFYDTIMTLGCVYEIMCYLARYRFTRYLCCSMMNAISCDVTNLRFFGTIGAVVRDKKMKTVILCIGLVSTALGLYISYKNSVFVKKEEKVEEKVDDVCDEFDVQGNLFGTTEDQLEKEKTNNVWYNADVQLTTFDVPQASASMAKASLDDIRNLFARNCVYLKIKVPGELTTRMMRGVFWRGHQLVTNAHAFKKEAGEYVVDIIITDCNAALSSNIQLSLKRTDIAFDVKNDVCLFDVNSLPPFKDLTPFWGNGEIRPTSGLELVRHSDGTLTKHTIFGMGYVPNLEIPELGNDFDVHYGHLDIPTQEGMCGSLCVATTPRGPIIFGIHVLGKANAVGVLNVPLQGLFILAEQACISKRPVVQSGLEPPMSCSVREMTLTEPHHRSLFRYLDTGRMNMYGSFTGFRPKPKSKVCATPLSEVMLQHYDAKPGYGPPVMSGWEPWRKNVVEMVKPKVNYDRKVLQECVDSFSKEIIHGLPKGWEGELVKLSDEAAVNGLAGVKYIDALAKNTSMGFPWSKTKKAFLFERKTEKHPDGVDFVPEVWDRVRIIEEKYARGERAYPVFTGHLKDEATPITKIRLSKTRLFTAAPVDWSLTVRKNLLSFVRLVQKNKFLFEAGPGTVTQSAEWGKIYDYLTQFGVDRMIAGDYGKYDKRMLADFILAAFEIIYNVHKSAGWPMEDLVTIMCIGEDIAFPVCNINGDLVEFFGTNPSGHPLTVIINSLVNSLYMRYAYATLNPQKEVVSFKKHVALFTYGDDNALGVHKLLEWYNHTAIQRVFADIGVEYTMADKGAKSVPFINIRDISFLKRKWVWSDEVTNWLAPLDEESIIKSLTFWVPSSTIDVYAQTVAVVESAINEYFFHGRKKFEEKSLFFQEVLKESPYCFYVKESTFPTYDQLIERFHKASGLESIALDSDEI